MGTMITIWRVELDRHPWHELRAASGSAAEIRASLAELLTAGSPDGVEAAYWQLENHVVVQGQLFGVAPCVVSVLLAALLEDSPPFVRIGVLELLFQILSGESHESEKDKGLGPKCRELGRCGLWLLYGELEANSPGQSAAAVEVLELLENDESRLRAFKSRL
jgi:hypothetical protein